MATEPPPQWRPSPIGLAALLLGEDLYATLGLPGADRDGQLNRLLERAFGAGNVESLIQSQPGGRRSLIDALLNAKMQQAVFPDPGAAYVELERLVDDSWKSEAKRLWSDFRPGFETLLATQLRVRGTNFKAPRVPNAIGDYELADKPLVKDKALLLEPVQGPWPDCWLVASMAATAWADLDAFNQFLEECVPPQQQGPLVEVLWRFRGQADGQLISNRFPRAVNGARIHTVSGSGNETWPALIEKAFALQEQRAQEDPPDATEPTLSQYQALSLHWPSKALELLLSKDYMEVGLDRVKYLRACCPANKVPMSPVVASSRDILDHLADDYRIVANHAYAVLGIDESSDQPYVVLREPYGHVHKKQRVDFSPVHFEGRSPVQVGTNGVIALPQHLFKQRFRNVSVPVGTQPAET